MRRPLNESNRSRRLIRNLLALVGGDTLSKLLLLIAFASLARALGPAGFGVVEVVVALSAFFAQLADLGVGAVGARAVARDPRAVRDLAARVPAARIVMACAAVPLAIGIAPLVADDARAAALAALFALGFPALALSPRWLLQGRERMAWVATGQALHAIVFVVGVLALVRSADDLLVVGAVEAAAMIATATLFAAIQHRQLTPFRLDFGSRGLRHLFREGFPVGLSQLAWTANQNLPPVLVAILVGSAAVGTYGAAQRIVLSLVAFSFVYHFNLFPALSKSLAESSGSFESLWRTSMRVTSWSSIGVAMGVTLFADSLCVLVFGDRFGESAGPLAVLIWALPLHFLSGHARWALIAAGHQRVVLAAQVAGVAATVGIGLFAIPRLGALGAAAAMVVSAAVVWGVAQAGARRWVRPVPFLAATVRPGAVAAAVLLLAGLLEWPETALAGVAVAVYVAAAFVVERAIWDDLRALGRALGPLRGKRNA